MRMPSRVKVGVHEFRILRPAAPKRNAEELLGWCDTEKLTIEVKRGMEKSKAQETLLHELCHTTTENADVSYEQEEKLVNAIAEGLLRIFKDNPGLVAYLTER
jgi:hypothetical protein